MTVCGFYTVGNGTVDVAVSFRRRQRAKRRDKLTRLGRRLSISMVVGHGLEQPRACIKKLPSLEQQRRLEWQAAVLDRRPAPVRKCR